jgi:DNA-binding MarR family transcriptional regulator
LTGAFGIAVRVRQPPPRGSGGHEAYSQALRPSGIEITQFTLLMALNLTGEASQGEVGELLALDSTTLTRTLSFLKKRRWIRAREGDDRASDC